MLFDYSKPQVSGVYVQELGSSRSKLLVRSTEGAIFAPPGYLLFSRDTTLYAQWIDLNLMELQGEPVVAAAEYLPRKGSASVSGNGVLTYRNRMGQGTGYRLFWYSRDGGRTAVGGEPNFWFVRISPDQKFAALLNWYAPIRELWIMELARGALSRVHLEPAAVIESKVAWAPDSRHVAVTVLMPGGANETRSIEVSSGAIQTLHSQTLAHWTQDWLEATYCFMKRTGKPVYFCCP